MMTGPVVTPVVDVLVNLRAHLDNLTLPQLKAFEAALQVKVDFIHTQVAPDIAISTNPDISRIEVALKLARVARMIRETQGATLPPAANTVITSTIAQLDAIDKAP